MFVIQYTRHPLLSQPPPKQPPIPVQPPSHNRKRPNRLYRFTLLSISSLHPPEKRYASPSPTASDTPRHWSPATNETHRVSIPPSTAKPNSQPSAPFESLLQRSFTHCLDRPNLQRRPLLTRISPWACCCYGDDKSVVRRHFLALQEVCMGVWNVSGTVLAARTRTSLDRVGTIAEMACMGAGLWNLRRKG